jgi:hypothetical protein
MAFYFKNCPRRTNNNRLAQRPNGKQKRFISDYSTTLAFLFRKPTTLSVQRGQGKGKYSFN